MKITSKDLIRVRMREGETQATFAKRFGVDRSTYTGWENGKFPKEGTAPLLIERVLAELSVHRSESSV